MFAFVYGNPIRLINGFDSFGNTCGVKSNEHFADFNLSGINTIDKPYVFFLDIKDWHQSLKICVKQCPTRDLQNSTELYTFYQQTGSQLCRYDFNMSLLNMPVPQGLTYFNILGPCPEVKPEKPVYQRYYIIWRESILILKNSLILWFMTFSKPILHRCIPTKGKIIDAYDTINSWSVAQQLFSDVYKTWPTVLIMCCAAFGELFLRSLTTSANSKILALKLAL